MPRIPPARPRLESVRPVVHDEVHVEEIRPGGEYENVRVAGEAATSLEWDRATIAESRLEGVQSLQGCGWSNGRLTDSVFTDSRVAVFTGRRMLLRDVEINGVRFGAVDLSGATLESVRFSNCRIEYLNLRGGQIRDVLFEGCALDELDLYSAAVNRLAFDDCRVATVAMGGTRTVSADLRGLDFGRLDGLDGLAGAVMSDAQTIALAPVLAAHFGIRSK